MPGMGYPGGFYPGGESGEKEGPVLLPPHIIPPTIAVITKFRQIAAFSPNHTKAVFY